MRIGSSVAEPLLALGVGEDERRDRVIEAMGLVGLDRRVLRLYPAELSAGQQQRVGIARAMITRPKLLVLDEPTSALDPTARADIIELLVRLQKQLGTAYLFISHDLSTVRFISHRVAVMYLGMIVEQGDAASVFAQPRHPYSVGLLSSVLLPNPHLRRASQRQPVWGDSEPDQSADRLFPCIPLPVRGRRLPRAHSTGGRSWGRAPGALHTPRRRRPDGPHRRHLRPVPRGGGAHTKRRRAGPSLKQPISQGETTVARLTGKRCLVTGAGRGIGRAIAIAFAREGAAVAVLDRREDLAAEVAGLLRDQGANAAAVTADVSLEASVNDGIAAARNALGGIDVLVNNAGIDTNSRVIDMPVAMWGRDDGDQPAQRVSCAPAPCCPA